MKIVPLFKCRDMRQALDFYTGVLDFRTKYQEAGPNDVVVDLVNDTAELQLTTVESDKHFGSVVNVWVDDVDLLYQKYISRGLDLSGHEDSPVHQAPLYQTWGTREFYVTDSDGNTLRFCMRR